MELNQRHLPLSQARSLEFQEHAPGTLLILPGWHAKPSPLCLAVKLGGTFPDALPGEAAIIVAGSPFGDEQAIGEIFRAAELRYVTKVLGLPCRIEVDADARAAADQSQQRSARDAIGALIVGASGVRIIGGSGEGYRRWGTPIDPLTWTATETNDGGSTFPALLSHWRLRIEFEGGFKSLIDVKADRTA